MGIRKSRKICIYLLAIFLIFSPIVVFDYSNNEKIQKEIKTSKNMKELEQEGQNYRLVTSADNVQVPVPKGYVASQIEGENYVTPEYQHTPTPHKGNYTQLNWSSPAGEQYPWTQDENGIWISGNQGIPDSKSTLESQEFDYIKGTTLTINYTYSCQNAYNTDYLEIKLIDLTNNIETRIMDRKYGNTQETFDYITSNYTYTMNDWATGRYKIKAIYSKNFYSDEGQDSGYIKASTCFKKDENGTETFEEDIKTRIHNGGFVIYQLTDEELEIDPNGTSIVIEDTNKDTAQATRNQYVWVPVKNKEDIIRTRTWFGGIIQFGQPYYFDKTSITKETSQYPNDYKEPRLVENYDIIKYHLQKYANIDKRENFLKEQQEEFNRMIHSVEKYEGFYIGRYETGDIVNSTENNFFTNPKVVRYNSNMESAIWYKSYDNLKRLTRKTEKYVETGIIYDTLKDYALKWLNETDTRSYKDLSENSGKWGNFSGIYFKYKESANGAEKTRPIDGLIKKTPTGGITEIIYNGERITDSPTSSNNIFDIAGSVREWTMARSDSYNRRLIEGDYRNASVYDPVDSFGYSNPNYSYGARSMLLIK